MVVSKLDIGLANTKPSRLAGQPFGDYHQREPSGAVRVSRGWRVLIINTGVKKMPGISKTVVSLKPGKMEDVTKFLDGKAGK